MKKLFTLMLAALMLLTLAVPAFAAEETGSITINGIGEKSVYDIYQLLDLESYNPASGAYSYKVNAAWAGLFATEAAKDYFAIDEAGYITWIAADDDDTVAAFAKSALAYAKANADDIKPVKSSTVDGDMTTFTNESGKLSGKFEGLTLGWYLVDSNVGALCGLTTTNPNASVNAKNGAPTIDKTVQEDSTKQWGDVNSADIGQIVNFRTTINVHAGAENYVIHDKMADSLRYEGVSKIEHIVPSAGTTTELTLGDDYVVATGEDLKDDCTFEVRFTKDFCDSLETNDKVVIYYSAMLLRGATIAGEGNTNEARLEYGEEQETTSDKTTTYTYKIDIVKTNSQNTLIDGAQFRVYDAATGGNEVAVVPMGEGVYRRAREDEKDDAVDIVVKDGKVTVVGFDNGTYYLEETVAPAGYNKLTARQKFIISDGNLEAEFNGEIYSTGSGVHVVNKTGSMLPETGGLGTTIFVAVGAVVMLACGVLLFTKKRMAQIAE